MIEQAYPPMVPSWLSRSAVRESDQVPGGSVTVSILETGKAGIGSCRKVVAAE
jgi:hypothetical protein